MLTHHTHDALQWRPHIMLRTDQLNFSLPDDRIATRPILPRDNARMLVVSRANPSDIIHAHIRDLPEYLSANDLLVRNTTAVLAARLRGHRADTQGSITGLFVESIEQSLWRCLLKSNAKLRPGIVIDLQNDSTLSLTLQTKHDDGSWIVEVSNANQESVRTILDRIGLTPIPPYILAARKKQGTDEPDSNDRVWYHTEFEDFNTLDAKGGSVASPTAGLHITENLHKTLEAQGVRTTDIVLHVGEGTFKPVESASFDLHPMHTERYCVPVQTIKTIETARREGGRVFAIGTTTARALESVDKNHPAGNWRETRLLITPGYEFNSFDALLTNFHLPRSTLLALVAALFPSGLDDLLPIYHEAINLQYRFYSYGDAMLILP